MINKIAFIVFMVKTSEVVSCVCDIIFRIKFVHITSNLSTASICDG